MSAAEGMPTGKALIAALELAGLSPHAEDDGTIVALCPVCDDQRATLRATTTPPAVECLLRCSTALVIEELRGLAEGITHAGARVALEVLCSEAERSRSSGSAGAYSPAKESVTSGGPARIALSTIAPQSISWLWLGRIPLGAVSSIDGMPAAGKSTVLAELVACVTTGRPLPADERPREARAALWIGHEEGKATAIRPRLDAAGADVDRVFVYDEMPSFPSDYGWLRRQIEETGAAVVVIDPIDAYMDFGVHGDSHRNGDVRARLAALATVAEETGAAIIMVRHWSKAGGKGAVYRAAGSLAYSALARAVASVARDPEDADARLIAWSKVSGGADVGTLAFSIEAAGASARVRWIGPDPRTADDIMHATDARAAGRGAGNGSGAATDAAEEWLMEVLEKRGQAPAKEMLEAGEGAGHTPRAIRRARERLGIRPCQVGMPDGGRMWVWRTTRPRPDPHSPGEPSTNGSQTLQVHCRAPDSSAPPEVHHNPASGARLHAFMSGALEADAPTRGAPDSNGASRPVQGIVDETRR